MRREDYNSRDMLIEEKHNKFMNKLGDAIASGHVTLRKKKT
jgi:hypothetical protein